MSVIRSTINAKRVLDAISHIGYSTESAISDIVDNSVSANASEVSIRIKAKDFKRKDSLQEIRIIDNGTGMDKEALENCMALGSSAEHYGQNSLSKFGMGLKSAGLSLGRRISVVSKQGENINKIVLDLDRITEEYDIEIGTVTGEDKKILEAFSTGTYVKIDKLREQHPTCRTIIEKLELDMSEIYYPMLKDATLKIKLTAFSEEEIFGGIEDKEIEPFDPLFENECHSDLNPETWDGKTPCWLLKKSEIQIKGSDVPIYITLTHLVHPPTFAFGDTELTQAEARKKYRIAERGNRHKLYIYRNNRLISRAYFGLLPREGKYYAFRGRIDISTAHDETLMLDVKKSSIRFSEDMLDKIGNLVNKHKKTSREAWERLSKKYTARATAGENSEIKEKVNKALEPYEEPSISLTPEEKQEREDIWEKEYSKAHGDARVDTGFVSDTPQSITDEGFLDEQKINYVHALKADQLYSPYQVQGEVRINISRGHKFSQFLLEHMESTPYEVRKAIEILLISLAYAENSVVKNFIDESISDQEKLPRLLIAVLEEFRHDFSINLTKNLSRFERISEAEEDS